MKNGEYWKRFVRTGKIDDYLNYIACTREDIPDDGMNHRDISLPGMDKDKEGGVVAGIEYRDGYGPVSHAGW